MMKIKRLNGKGKGPLAKDAEPEPFTSVRLAVPPDPPEIPTRHQPLSLSSIDVILQNPVPSTVEYGCPLVKPQPCVT